MKINQIWAEIDGLLIPIDMKAVNKKFLENLEKSMENAKCNNCGHIQPANLGFECKKCGGQTFTKKEEEELSEKPNSKFVPLE